MDRSKSEVLVHKMYTFERRCYKVKVRSEYICPLEITHDIIHGKWKPIILWQLGKGTASLSQLEREINGISQKMLLQHLKELINFTLVRKEVFDGYPLKVEYSLLPNGQKMLNVVALMQEVGSDLLAQKVDTY